MAMLIDRRRLAPKVTAKEFLATLIARCGLRVLPITIDIALRSQQLTALQGDPANRLIASIALEHEAPLVTADERIAALP